MKLIHLSDLHIGKRVNEVSMLEDQEYVLRQILQIIDAEKADAVLIAGDVYDKSIPPAEAVTLFDDFLCRLAKRDLPVFIISGNHDSPERLAFGNRLLEHSGIHISPVYSGKIESVTLTDEYGAVNFWLLPFVKPVHVKRFYPDENYPARHFKRTCKKRFFRRYLADSRKASENKKGEMRSFCRTLGRYAVFAF